MPVNYLFRSFCVPFVIIFNKINWRFKRSYQIKKNIFKNIKSILKPGMVILTHKNYELTNLFIRGHWKHAAIVISKTHLVEANRNGVEKLSIEESLTSVDDFILLEPAFCGLKSMKLASDFAKRVIGLPYNFQFITTKNSFYCSELIYKAYQMSDENFRKFIPKLISKQNKIISPNNLFEWSEMWKIAYYKGHA